MKELFQNTVRQRQTNHQLPQGEVKSLLFHVMSKILREKNIHKKKLGVGKDATRSMCPRGSSHGQRGHLKGDGASDIPVVGCSLCRISNPSPRKVVQVEEQAAMLEVSVQQNPSLEQFFLNPQKPCFSIVNFHCFISAENIHFGILFSCQLG